MTQQELGLHYRMVSWWQIHFNYQFMLLMNYAFRTDMMSVYNAKTFIKNGLSFLNQDKQNCDINANFVCFKPFNSFILSFEAI